MDDGDKKYHYNLFSYTFNQDNGKATGSFNMFRGMPNRNITEKDIADAEKFAKKNFSLLNSSVCLMSISYLGHMTKAEFNE